jgi:hypothetical protein
MNAGRDVDGFWTLLESSLWYVPLECSLYVITCPQVLCRRVAHSMGYLPSPFNLEKELHNSAFPAIFQRTDPRAVADGRLAIVAGSDTTSNVLTAVLYYLLRNPAAYERLQEEVEDAFHNGEEPLDVTKLGQMKWLNGCMWVCDALT